MIVFLLLSGVLPFDDENEEKVAYMIKTTPANFGIGKWRIVSKEAIDFTSRLMASKQSERMQINEAI